MKNSILSNYKTSINKIIPSFSIYYVFIMQKVKLMLIERKWWLEQMIDAVMPVVGVKMPIQAKPEQRVIRM